MRDRAHSDAMSELFRADPGYAVELLREVLVDGNPEELIILLQQLVNAFNMHGNIEDA
ncbi:Addiction module antidote protein [Pseudomonas synxantha]|nr:Addiction module antidote protein [Pseudomonas synxantha]